MGCNCGSSASGSASRITSALRYEAPATNISFDGCTYTLEQLQDWLTKIKCFREKGLLANIPSVTNRLLNMYEGIVLSAVNYASNVCYFKKQLDDVQSFITVVISTGQC